MPRERILTISAFLLVFYGKLSNSACEDQESGDCQEFNVGNVIGFTILGTAGAALVVFLCYILLVRLKTGRCCGGKKKRPRKSRGGSGKIYNPSPKARAQSSIRVHASFHGHFTGRETYQDHRYYFKNQPVPSRRFVANVRFEAQTSVHGNEVQSEEYRPKESSPREERTTVAEMLQEEVVNKDEFDSGAAGEESGAFFDGGEESTVGGGFDDVD